MKINNINKLEDEFIWKSKNGLATKFLGNAAGSEKLYINVDKIMPGFYSCRYHAHSLQEEFFLILTGKGLMRYNGDEYEVSEGDFISKPAGKRNAHQFYNNSDDVLEILDVGSVERDDVCYYPDDNMYLVRENGKPHFFKEENELEDWETDPNE